MSSESTDSQVRRDDSGIPLGPLFIGALLAVPLCWALFGNFAGPAIWLVILMAWWFIRDVRRAIAPSPPTDRLTATVRVWLDDPRPAWETVAAFERDVERVLSGQQTTDYVERMPLRAPGVKAKSLPRLGTPGYTGPVIKPKRCRHRWTMIPPGTVDAFARLDSGKVRLPDMYAGRTVGPWCVKCRRYKDGRPVPTLVAVVRKVKSDAQI